jgi:hypothetical protein
VSVRDRVRDSLSDPAEVAEMLGLSRSKEERQKWTCPAHGGTSLSLSVGRDGTLRVRCFGCDLSGDIFSLIGAVEGLSDFSLVLERAAEYAGYADELAAERKGYRPTRSAPRPRRIPPPPPPPSYPPVEEVWAAWEACTPLWEAPSDLRTYLDGRAIDAVTASRFGLVRATAQTMPAWAVFGDAWHARGYRLVCPIYDSQGVMRSLRAWSPTSATHKRIAPKGFTTEGLVLADLHALAMLRGEGTPRRVFVVEGEPDFLVTSLAYRLTEPNRPAVLGVVAGAWSKAIAAKVPDGADVRVATHEDDAGEKYASEILDSLADRCAVTRVCLGGSADVA